ncbi:tRNA (adenosine(37)-N6)-threonylcarbamoyltransferase complex dimerization subunit type 1 TsaB [Pseudooceanicola algae]|uniref:Gcp-like domain-containing protein n=1 Tax=Pseudooceanicola algae TaxID=1537215 RepID=A0A418SKR4_9RHOB|nr:tRNA (adenosine(37)-N6)-threonylcarbamoyltransferase complex dimerization subunit type 1 TsaB [Pseudooceanicola algae]QPM90997.1 hypothetical protein PSAL_022400 [Pseudooceanicola algae]
MPSDDCLLAFDTSAAHCAAALLCNGVILAERRDPMAKGQGEHLVPLLEDLLGDASLSWSDLTALAVGTGPGNFTGLRISVALVRGLALALKIPAIGVTGFEALALDAPRPMLATLPAPRDQLYGQLWTKDGVSEAQIFAADQIPPDLQAPGMALLGAIRGAGDDAPVNPAIAIARAAAAKGAQPQPPAPFYLRPADAAPPRDAPPRILP